MNTQSHTYTTNTAMGKAAAADMGILMRTITIHMSKQSRCMTNIRMRKAVIADTGTVRKKNTILMSKGSRSMENIGMMKAAAADTPIPMKNTVLKTLKLLLFPIPRPKNVLISWKI